MSQGQYLAVPQRAMMYTLLRELTRELKAAASGGTGAPAGELRLNQCDIVPAHAVVADLDAFNSPLL